MKPGDEDEIVDPRKPTYLDSKGKPHYVSVVDARVFLEGCKSMLVLF